MSNPSNTTKRVARYLRQMKKAMPAIMVEIEVYEQARKKGTLIRSPKPAPQFKHG